MIALLACTIISLFISNPALPEVSGMIATSNSIYVHNDSGDGPYIYQLSHNGNLTTTYQFANITPTDLEAIAIDREIIYIGDVGRNGNDNPVYTVHRYPVSDTITFRFPNNLVYDIESMVVINGTIMVAPKIAFSHLWIRDENGIMKDVGELRTHDDRAIHNPTDMTRYGDQIIIRTYTKLHLFDWSRGVKLMAKKELPMLRQNGDQGEAVALLKNIYWTMSEYAGRAGAFLHRYEGCLQ